MQSGNRNLVIFTSDLSGYEDSNCFSLMEIKTCLPCQLLNVEIAAGCGIKYLIYGATLWKAVTQELYGFVWYKSFIWEEKQQPLTISGCDFYFSRWDPSVVICVV